MIRKFRAQPIRNRQAVRHLLGDYGQDDSNAFPQEPQYNDEEVFAPPRGNDGIGFSTPPQAVVSANGVPYTLYPFVLNATAQILPGNQRRAILIVQNQSAADDLYINFGQGAGVNFGLLLPAGEGLILDEVPPTDQIFAFFDSATPQSGIVIEGSRQA